MKTRKARIQSPGFTLMELMVAMAITTIIVTVLVSITSIAIDTWTRSRSELRASRQAKAMVDTMARDFESLVFRRGNQNEWLSCETDVPGSSSNASKLVFFTAATDRYSGMIGDPTIDKGGDVSCVGYRLSYKDPIGGGTTTNQTFVLNRHLVDPKPTFDNLLGKTSSTITLGSLFKQYEADLNEVENFICENVYQFTVSFNITVMKNTGSELAPVYTSVPVTLTTSQSSSGLITKNFRLLGSGIEAEVSGGAVGVHNINEDEIKGGRLTSVGIFLTVLSDAGVDQLRTRNIGADKLPETLKRHSYQYSKVVQLPGM